MNIDFAKLVSIETGLAALVGLAIMVLLVKDLKMAVIPLAGLIFMGALGGVAEGETKYGRIVQTWLFPVQSLRTEAYIVFGALLFLGGLLHVNRLNLGAIAVPAALYTLMGVYNGLANIYHLGPSEGVITTLHALLTMGSLALVIPGMLNELDDWYRLLRVFMVTMAVWMVCVLIQVGVNHNAITLGNAYRFTGLTGNPQHAAVLMAITTMVAMWLWLNENHIRYKPIWGVLGAISVVMLGWTGSRTGTIMLVAGSTFILYSRLGRAILLLPIGAIGAIIFATVLQNLGIDLGLDRLTSTEDTRSAAWENMLSIALQNPVLGAGTAFSGNSENSYLYAAASYGVLSLLLLLGAVGGAMFYVVRLLKAKAIVETHFSKLCDLCAGVYVAFALGAFAEGFAIARVSVMVVLFMMFLGMGTRILQGARWQVMTGNFAQAQDDAQFASQ